MATAWITISVHIVTGDRDNFEEVPGTVRSQVQHLGIVLFPDGHGMVHCMEDVAIGDPVLACRRVDRMARSVVITIDRAELVTSPAYDQGLTRETLIATYLERLAGLER